MIYFSKGPRHLNNEAGDWSKVLAQDLQSIYDERLSTIGHK